MLMQSPFKALPLELFLFSIFAHPLTAWVLPDLNALVPRVLKVGNTAVYNKAGIKMRTGEVLAPTGSNSCRGIYGVNVNGDLPFNRANRGNLMLYPKGEGNEPSSDTDKWL